MYSARIILDSLNPTGQRLTTFELYYPRMVHAELMTHRIFSRNAASSRAIPIERFIKQVMEDPAMPVWWGKNQAGMQAREELVGDAKGAAIAKWLEARDLMVLKAKELSALGVHKQIANRLLEPWQFIGVLVSATSVGNWFNLRRHPDAQPEIQHLANLMWHAYFTSVPTQLYYGDWHLPYVREEEKGSLDVATKLSVARCARISYLNHDGVRDVEKDLLLHDRLRESGHWSPFEHCAMAVGPEEQSGNFRGFRQYRKMFRDEHREDYEPAA
jgi:thymidylate synthase ThyX